MSDHESDDEPSAAGYVQEDDAEVTSDALQEPCACEKCGNEVYTDKYCCDASEAIGEVRQDDNLYLNH